METQILRSIFCDMAIDNVSVGIKTRNGHDSSIACSYYITRYVSPQLARILSLMSL